jgi:Immunity protein 52
MSKAASTEHKQYILKAFWFGRLQDAQECSITLIDFLKHLESLSTPFVNWDHINTKGRSEPIPSNVDEVRKQLLLPRNGAKRGVQPDTTMPIMGFDVLLFSEGKNSERVTLEISYGISDEGGRNRCYLDLPTKGEPAIQVLQPETLKSLLEIVVKAWNPDWAVIDYFDYNDPDRSIDYIPIYWFVYLSEQRGRIPAVPRPSCVGHIEGYGSYVITTPEPFTRERPDHLEAANQVRSILGQAGLLTARPN